MRVAVSDYDGTLNIEHKVSPETIDAIAAWRKAGNVFGIATGRDLSLTLHETGYWHIPFDFLICVNGAILYDAKLNVLQSVSIPDALTKALLHHPSSFESTHYQMSSDGLSRVYIRNARSIFNNIKAPFEKISLEEALQQNNLQQLSLGYATEDEHERFCGSLISAFKDYLSFNKNSLTVDINYQGINKLSGILDLIKIKEWPAEGLLTIGDNHNDVSMIRHFNGFAVNNSLSEVVEAAAKVYGNVGEMLSDHM